MSLQALYDQLGEAPLASGEVAIVGAGPGDPAADDEDVERILGRRGRHRGQGLFTERGG